MTCRACRRCHWLRCPRLFRRIEALIRQNSGGGGGVTFQSITETAYNALPDPDKNNPDILWIIIP